MPLFSIANGKKIIASVSACFILSMIIFNAAYALNPVGIQVYQRSIHETPAKLESDIERYRNADNLWDVLREEFSLPHYETNPMVQEKINWYMRNQAYLLRATSRAAPYLYYILQQVKIRHLPAELVLLPIVESGYNPFAISSVGASGLWQMMPDTASGFGVKQNWWYDGRRDVITSTSAALDYLAYLENFFNGNWLLATAAYNTGEGNVLNAIKRNVRDGRSTNFWDLPVAQQTKDYVPSILALAIIISHPDQYPVFFPPVKNAPYLAEVDVGKQIDLKIAATLAGISYTKLMQLNPGFNRITTASQGPYKIILPIEQVAEFTQNMANHNPNYHDIWFHYKVRRGETLLTIARKFNTTTAALKNINTLNGTSVRMGNDIRVPKQGDLATSFITTAAYKQFNSKTALNAKPTGLTVAIRAAIKKYVIQPGDTIYMVRSNDTLEKIAKHYHISNHDLMVANNTLKTKMRSGQQIIIPTHFAHSNGMSITQGKKMLPSDTFYTVKQGDTIAKIARKFNTSAAEIRLANLVKDTTLNPGVKLVIPTHFAG